MLRIYVHMWVGTVSHRSGGESRCMYSTGTAQYFVTLQYGVQYSINPRPTLIGTPHFPGGTGPGRDMSGHARAMSKDRPAVPRASAREASLTGVL